MQFGRFELLERIGVGGMAEVWKARVAGIGGFEKIVVVKKILPAFAQNKTFIEMLLAEARLCAVLHHTNIVQTYENGEFEGQYYIAMEWVSGHDLFKLLSRATSVNRRLPVEICLFIAAEVAKGLAYAHSAKDNQGRPLHIIHRDVSPSNVLVSEAGEVKVMDFGVARAQADGQNRDGQSRAGVLKGKLGYMSPEQVTGQPFDHRADIFSLGIILYESITLKRLFLGRTDLETLVNIRDARIEHKFRKHSYIEEPVRVVLRRALARNADERYPTALEMHDDIVNMLFEQKIQVTNRTIAAFLTELFDPSLEIADPASIADDNGAPPPVLPAPVHKSSMMPAAQKAAQSLAAEPPAHSLSFSIEEMRQQRAEIARRRESAMQISSPAVSTKPETTQVELGGVPARRSSRVASTDDLSARVDAMGGFRTPPPSAGPAATAAPQTTGTFGARASTEWSPGTRGPGDRRVDSVVVTRGSGERVAGARSNQAGASDSPQRPGDDRGAHEGRTGAQWPPGQSSSVLPARPTSRVSQERAAIGSSMLGSSPLRLFDNEPPLASDPQRPYHIRTGDGHVIGPMSEAALVGMIKSRTLVPEDGVSVSAAPFRQLGEVTQLRGIVSSFVGQRAAPVDTGPLSRLTFPNLIYRLYADRSTGCLEMRREGAVKSIYVRRGRPQHIASNQRLEMLGAFLVSQGFVGQHDVDIALEHANSTGGRLGDILVGLNLIKPYQLYQVLERQFRAKFIEAFSWEGATYAFYANETAPEDIVPLDLDPLSTLVEGVRLNVPLSVLEPHFEPWLDTPYKRTRSPKISVEAMRFQAREAKALGMLMSSRTLREVVEERCKSRQQKLAILHVLFLMLQTELLAFEGSAG